jgi:energy-coupling factor transporter transmembrane protein EcfT
VGPLTAERYLSLDPSVRMICGVILFAGILGTDTSTPVGMVAVTVPASAAFLLYRRASMRILWMLLAGSLMYLPAMFWSPPGIVLKGLSASIAIMAPALALSPQETAVVVMRLPLPAFIGFLVLQVLHQSGVLIRETHAIHRAVMVRGGVHGLRGVHRFARILPEAWLPRVALRADRVTIAMDLRSYGQHTPRVPPVAWGVTGCAALACSVLLAGAAMWCSLGRGG